MDGTLFVSIVETKREGEVMVCKECGKELDDMNHYHIDLKGTELDICKDCVKSKIDIYNPETFIDYLEQLDVPYIKEEWENRAYRYNNNSVFGRYLALMKLKGYAGYKFKDSERLNRLREIKNSRMVV